MPGGMPGKAREGLPMSIFKLLREWVGAKLEFENLARRAFAGFHMKKALGC